MKKSLVFALSALSSLALAQETQYDNTGHLIIPSSQAQRDQMEGISARGGYNPQAAAAHARLQRAQREGSPSLGNIEEQNTYAIQGNSSIYRCLDGKKAVFADENSKEKFTNCTLLRKGHNEAEIKEMPIPQEALAAYAMESAPSINTCGGILLYKGNTYHFSEEEPCPIPDHIFQARTPLEADPNYYLEEKTNE